MQKSLRKIFSNDLLFTISSALTVFTMLASCVYFIPHGIVVNVFYNLALAAAFAVMYFSFRSHSKNVMKGIIGLSLGLILSYIATSFILFFADPSVTYLPFSVAAFPLYIAVTVIHLLINSSHHSSPRLVLANQILLLILIILSVVLPIIGYNTPEYLQGGKTFFLYCGTYAYTFTAITILCIETRLDVYRTEREANGWTEEQAQ